MMFWFKPKEIVVDCFTYHHSIYDYYKPLNASKFIPDGWKKLPKTFEVKTFPNNPNSNLMSEVPTIKTCNGFINLYRTGFIIQNHCEIIIEADANANINASSSDPNISFISQHQSYQLWDDIFKEYTHVKLTTPWYMVEKTGVKFMYSKCTWNDTNVADNFHVVSGILDFKIQHNSHINFYMKKNSILRLYAGQPVAHIIPLSENKIKLKHHLISREEYSNRFIFSPATKLYSEFLRIKTKKECPFGFGK